MLEKLKDIMYDVKVPDKSNVTEPATDDPNLISIEEVDSGEGANNTENAGEVATGTANESSSGETTQPEAQNTATPNTSTEAKPGGTTVNLVPVSKTIDIKAGSSGYSIGKLLESEGLVTDTNTFIKRVEELGLGAKLRSGSFKLSTDMSLDEVIYKISGQ